MGEARPLRLRYTLPALAELDQILDYVALRSPQGARRVQRRIQALIELLPRHPRLGGRTDHPAIRRLAILPFPYLVFYEATDTEIIIPSDMPGSS
jgi:plasmid stabilization system protein ParE